ncbi:MAG: sorbosone dehydrogenase family protein, partial [Chloroflexota bacterium]|nr:sorbosone dehydrogenase family protein [Chloroflexota bacterium]
VRVRFADGRPTGEVEDFITGWLQPNGRSWGRPVDVTVAPDGSPYLSDDALGVVYRIAYQR